MNALAHTNIHQALRSKNASSVREATICLLHATLSSLKEKDFSGEGVRIAKALMRDLREPPPIEHSYKMLENFRMLRQICRSVGSEVLAGQYGKLVQTYECVEPWDWPFWTKPNQELATFSQLVSKLPPISQAKKCDVSIRETVPAGKRRAA